MWLTTCDLWKARRHLGVWAQWDFGGRNPSDQSKQPFSLSSTRCCKAVHTLNLSEAEHSPLLNSPHTVVWMHRRADGCCLPFPIPHTLSESSSRSSGSGGCGRGSAECPRQCPACLGQVRCCPSPPLSLSAPSWQGGGTVAAAAASEFGRHHSAQGSVSHQALAVPTGTSPAWHSWLAQSTWQPRWWH